MGQAKLRQKIDKNFGIIPKSLQTLMPDFNPAQPKLKPQTLTLLGSLHDLDCPLSVKIKEVTQLIMAEENKIGKIFSGAKVGNKDFLEAAQDFPELFILWFEMVLFTEDLKVKDTTKKEVARFWVEYWTSAIHILGKADIRNSQTGDWFPLLKGIAMFALDRVGEKLSKSCCIEFASFVEAMEPILSPGETTIEIGLAFRDGRIIYDGQSLIVYKGVDSATKGRGELMVAVKHASGCWSHYPSPDNDRIPLSDYRKAKSEIAKISTPLRGELINHQSTKVAKLFGLTADKKYAYWIPPTLR